MKSLKYYEGYQNVTHVQSEQMHWESAASRLNSV